MQCVSCSRVARRTQSSPGPVYSQGQTLLELPAQPYETPPPLSGFGDLQGSVRVNIRHRLVYQVLDDVKTRPRNRMCDDAAISVREYMRRGGAAPGLAGLTAHLWHHLELGRVEQANVKRPLAHLVEIPGSRSSSSSARSFPGSPLSSKDVDHRLLGGQPFVGPIATNVTVNWTCRSRCTGQNAAGIRNRVSTSDPCWQSTAGSTLGSKVNRRKPTRPRRPSPVKGRMEYLFYTCEDTRDWFMEHVGDDLRSTGRAGQPVNRFYLENLAIGMLRPVFNLDVER